MRLETKRLFLPEGDFEVEVMIFDHQDRAKIQNLYQNWISLSKDLKLLNARALPMPEGLSESAICLSMGWYRVNSVKKVQAFNSSFDCYCPEKRKRIQVKASSISEDLTSFGPKSVWDILCFLDFYVDGKWNGSFDVYLFDDKNLLNDKFLNAKSGQTFTDQQKQGRRPRLSLMKSVIIPLGKQPDYRFSLL